MSYLTATILQVWSPCVGLPCRIPPQDQVPQNNVTLHRDCIQNHINGQYLFFLNRIRHLEPSSSTIRGSLTNLMPRWLVNKMSNTDKHFNITTVDYESTRIKGQPSFVSREQQSGYDSIDKEEIPFVTLNHVLGHKIW